MYQGQILIHQSNTTNSLSLNIVEYLPDSQRYQFMKRFIHGKENNSHKSLFIIVYHSVHHT
jgi:hypothetical protein